MISKFNINRKDESLTWQMIIARISLGFELQKLERDLTTKDILDYNDSIVIDPDYQREYRSTIIDESSLIESAFLEIPIPPIFLATQKFRGVQVLNVVDGQHRLRAFFRFINNQFKLSSLKLLPELNDLTFDDLAIEDKTNLLSRGITCITFRDFPGKEFELEIFSRYNKGTKPLTPQEIRHAVYDSKINDHVNAFCSKLVTNQTSSLARAYSVSKDRFLKKTIQENIFVILSIIEFGVNQTYINESGRTLKIAKSPQYAESYMKIKSENESDDDFIKSEQLFLRFNDFISKLSNLTEHPFSREIYGVTERGNKFQVSISMILAAIFRKLDIENFDFTSLNDKDNLKNLGDYIKHVLSSSYLEDPEYSASTTNPIEIQKVVEFFSFRIEEKI